MKTFWKIIWEIWCIGWMAFGAIVMIFGSIELKWTGLAILLFHSFVSKQMK
jgi:hypothetical protein